MKETILSHVTKVEYNYDLERIKEELKLLPDFGGHQIYLQGNSPDMDPLTQIGYKGARDIDAHELDFTYNLFPELVYINSILVDLHIVRARVMILQRKECYTWHDDNCERWHLPVQSGNGAFFIFKDGMAEMKADGSIYKADTRRWHSAINGTQHPRIHIVGAPCKDFIYTGEYDSSQYLDKEIIKTGIRDLQSCETVGDKK